MTFLITAEYMQQEGRTSGKLTVNFFQGNLGEFASSDYQDYITVYRPVINGCGSVCPTIPISASKLRITGVEFGTSTSPQEVSVQLSDGQCRVLFVNETELICEVVVGFSSPGILKAIVWRGDRASIFESWMSELWTPIFQITVAPAVASSIDQLPWNAPNMTLRVSNIASESGQVNVSTLAVTVQAAGLKLDCPIISLSTDHIICNTTGLFPSDVRGSISALVSRQSGESDPALVATIVQEPTISANRERKYASNAKVFSIEGVAFGTSKQDLDVLLSLDSGPTVRRSAVQMRTQITSLSDRRIDFRLEDQNATLPAGQNLTAIVYRLGAPSEPNFVASIVPQPSIVEKVDYRRATSAPELTIQGSNFGSDRSLFSITLVGDNSTLSCTPTLFNDSTIVCFLTGSAAPGPLSANVNVYGGQSETVTIAEIVLPPQVISEIDRAIVQNSTAVRINGTGFDTDATTLVALFSYDSNEGNAFACNITDLDENGFTCNTSPLITKGSLFARVQSYGGWSNWSQVGVVGNLDSEGSGGGGGGANNTGSGNAIAFWVWIIIAVAGLVMLIAVIAVVVLRRRHLNMQKRHKIDIPEDMQYIFNIRASDLEFMSKLGEGSFGAVWLGKYKGRHVAIKKLTASVLGSQVTEFFREASLMSAIKPHGNVVRMLGMCQEMGNLSIVMEFLSGGCLDQYLKTLKEDGQNLPADDLYKIVIGIARGMAHLAESHIIHRDLAARNILLDGNHEPRVSDFGFSRIVGDSDQGQTKATVGPIRWMSPENIESQTYSSKSDVWSFGIILFEITQKEAPYQNEDLITVAMSIRDKARNPLPDMKTQPPKYLGDLMEMCFKVSPAERPTFDDIVTYLLQNAPSAEALSLAQQANSAASLSAPIVSPPTRTTTKKAEKRKTEPAGYGPITAQTEPATEVEMQRLATQYENFDDSEKSDKSVS
jgi:serine/threonine protein kinase